MQSIIERMGQGWKLARNVSLRKDPKEDVREKSVEKSTDSLQHGSPLYRKQKTKMIKQRPINTVMKITNNPAARDRPQTMDEERQGHTAYNYLCHLESTRRWMEACLQEELPETIDMERALSNGVYLARLAKIFDRDPGTQRAKIYDNSLEIFEVSLRGSMSLIVSRYYK
ncbi:hypothetical protein SARC_03857 [Sphaeroforma arctica JP610]|uniref:Calponin-homology (CH) domain-containing protein n=1 Tax=Sphaeroforma arctica JP610 TaxID=667725 RepID=A0A0L0G6N5_9EUKA|nr:hypothetical protein SARC_03857 [Sphaeroforma arctica JP610]KNC83898.1 hypothetical protein SARC_03857 [Sphaeroforma arctica JP610]|eukprot:XP_014157800.1 hypothetical protein SARC_03857 [Sphaeroforma arctica JP610]